MSDAALIAQGVAKAFVQGGQRLPVLRGVDLTVAPSERVGIVGRSGPARAPCCTFWRA